MKERKMRDFLKINQVNINHLPTTLAHTTKGGQITTAYDAYKTLQPVYSDLFDITLKKNYAEPSMALTAHLLLEWKRITAELIRPQKKIENEVDPRELVIGMSKTLTTRIAQEVEKRACVPKAAIGRFSHELAYRSIYWRGTLPIETVAEKVGQQLFSRFKNYPEIAEKITLFAQEAYVSIWDTLWKEAARYIPKVKTKTSPQQAKYKKALWNHCVRTKKYGELVLRLRALIFLFC
jgi:hypothetical protein